MLVCVPVCGVMVCQCWYCDGNLDDDAGNTMMKMEVLM